MKTMFRAPTLYALTAGALCVSSAWSQDSVATKSAPAAEAASAPTESDQVQTVTVTAQRREAVLSKVPLSVAAIGAENIDEVPHFFRREFFAIDVRLKRRTIRELPRPVQDLLARV